MVKDFLPISREDMKKRGWDLRISASFFGSLPRVGEM